MLTKKFGNSRPLLFEIYFFLLNLNVILLFFRKINLINISIVLLAVTSILLQYQSYRVINKKNYLYLGAFLLYFILIVLSFFLSENKGPALRSLHKSIYIIVVPFSIILGPKIDKKKFKIIFKNYLYAVVLYSLIAFFGVVYLNWIQVVNKFSYEAYGEALGIHTAYFGMFVSFGVAITLVRIYQSSENRVLFYNFLLLAFLFFVFYLLASRTALVSALVIFVLITVYYLRERRNAGKLIFIFFIIFTFGVFSVKQGFLKERVKTTIYEYGTEQSDIQSRMNHWKSALDSYVEQGNYVLGNGTGDTQELLNKYYKLSGFFGYKFSYNAHNQYLESLISLGLLGFLILLVILLLGFYLAIKHSSILFFSYMTIISICFITESMLERQRGITFFVILISIFINYLANNLGQKNNRII